MKITDKDADRLKNIYQEAYMKRLFIISVMMLFSASGAFSFSFNSSSGSNNEAMQLYVRATEHITQGNFRRAIPKLTRAARLRPDLPEVFHNLGFAFERVGEFENSIEAYKRALRLKPDYASALNNLGYLFATTEIDTERAVALCQRAVQLNPRSANFRDSLGWAFYKNGQPDHAMRNFKTATELNPSFYKSHFNMGLLEYNRQNHEASVKHFSNAVSANPDYYRSYLPLADSFEKLGDENRALHFYRQALNRMPDDDRIKGHIEEKVKKLTDRSRNSYFSNMRNRQGSTRLREFMERQTTRGSIMNSPSSSSVTHQVSDSRFNSNVNFAPVSALSPTTNSALNHSGTQSGIVRNNDSGTTFRSSTASNNNNRNNSTFHNSSIRLPSTYSASSVHIRRPQRQMTMEEQRQLERRFSLSRSYYNRGLIDEAKKELKFILDRADESSGISRQASSMLTQINRRFEDQKIERAKKHRDMGKDFFRAGQYDLALNQYNNALRLTPECSETHKDMALLYYNQGKFDEAYEKSKRAIALNRLTKEAYVVLGSLYAQKGRTNDAIRTLEMVERVSTRRDSVDDLAIEIIRSIKTDGGI